MTCVLKRMPLFLSLLASITVLSLDALAIDKDKKFKPPELDRVTTKQTTGDVTIGVVPYDRSSLAEAAFGKVDPYEHGILPVLVMVRNDTKQALRLDSMKVEYRD